MEQHYCLNPSYPGGRIVCLCVRGVDHDEAQFDVPLEDDADAAAAG